MCELTARHAMCESALTVFHKQDGDQYDLARKEIYVYIYMSRFCNLDI